MRCLGTCDTVLCKMSSQYMHRRCCTGPVLLCVTCCARRLQDVIARGSKVHALYARTVEAKAARAIVIPAQPARGMQVTRCSAMDKLRRLSEPVQHRCGISQCGGASFLRASAEHAAVLAVWQQRCTVRMAGT